MGRHIRNSYKVKEGFSCQEKAKILFDNGDFEEAFYFYKEAEKLYREGYEWPGTRVFFMQCTALRCLEELIDNGRVDFLNLYQKEGEEFFKEWTGQEINSKIVPSRREEAFAFRLWRASHFKVCPDFYDVNAALERNEFEGARKILDNLTSKLESNPFPESDALCAIAKAKRETITVREQLKRSEDQRDISAIADAYKRAAEASQLPKNSISQQRERLEAFRDWFLSCEFKFRAFARLKGEEMRNPIPALTEAKEFLDKAVEHAEKALSSVSGIDFPKSHCSYLRFWKAIISERLHLLKFMETGKEVDFGLSVQAWKDALIIAEEFLKQSGEETIFPNRFYSLQDLKLEKEFLEAAYAFRQRKWSEVVTYLDKWRQEFPQEYRWSWRDIQVYIRLLFAKALCAFSEEDQQKLHEICKELERVEKLEPVGNVGRFLVAEAKSLQMRIGMPLNNDYVDLLCSCFPPDSYADNYQTESEIDPFLSFPERIYNWLDQTRSPSTNAEVKECKAKVLGLLEALLGYICDYHLQSFSSSESIPSPDLEVFIERLLDLASIHWGQRKSLIASIESLKEAVEQLKKVKESELYKHVYEKIHGALKELARITPVTVEIKSATPSKEEPRGIEAFPDWVLHHYRPGREKIFIFASPETMVSSGKYYLPPEWRKGNRISYPMIEARPLLPVRYQAKWEFWEREAANAALLILEGVSLTHLKRTIELAGKCRSEAGKPKVGAVIVKEGRVIAEAFRGEDGSDKHAEEIAIGKCKKQDLIGATLITTLEPCIPPARSPDKASCTHLIIQNGIKKVIIGIIDPNREVHGGGDLLLRRNGIFVAYFPSELSREIWALNKEFIGRHTEQEFMPMYIYKPAHK